MKAIRFLGNKCTLYLACPSIQNMSPGLSLVWTWAEIQWHCIPVKSQPSTINKHILTVASIHDVIYQQWNVPVFALHYTTPIFIWQWRFVAKQLLSGSAKICDIAYWYGIVLKSISYHSVFPTRSNPAAARHVQPIWLNHDKYDPILRP